MADEPVVSLNQPVAARGTPRTFFFNGRLLSAEDLRREQSLRENGQSQLARLLGCGIAGGLSVTQTGNSRIDIASGLGVTPSGRIIDLIGQTIDLAGMAAAVRPGGFGDCAAAMANRERPAAGIYLLVLTPAWLASGRAATLLGEVGACNRNLEQPAVRARLLAVVAPAGSTDANARNAIAHALLADADPASLPTQPDVVNPPSGGQSLIGWWPAQVVPTLAADDLPLAVLRIDPYAKLVWLDAAAAQRRLAPPPGLAGDSFWRESHAIEMEAFARQFVDQLSDQAGDQDALNGQKVDPPSSSRAARFTFLPPLLRLDARQLLLLRGQLGETLSLTGCVQHRPRRLRCRTAPGTARQHARARRRQTHAVATARQRSAAIPAAPEPPQRPRVRCARVARMANSRRKDWPVSPGRSCTTARPTPKNVRWPLRCSPRHRTSRRGRTSRNRPDRHRRHRCPPPR
jgi:hypothetical protein